MSKSIFNIENIREDFPVLHRDVNGYPLTYLDSGASSQKPVQVIDRIEQYYRNEHANIHRGVHHLSQGATQAYEHARNTIAKFIHAKNDFEVLFTKGTTDSINLVASSFGRKFLGKGDEVIISTMEHHSNIVPWQMICEEKGANLKVIPINHNGEILMEEFEKPVSYTHLTLPTTSRV